MTTDSWEVETVMLDKMRSTLIRQEETIIFSLIERAQFKLNETIYQPEIMHAKVGRYQCIEENPFYPGELLPSPLLPSLPESHKLKPNRINFNSKIFGIYVNDILPAICESSDCHNYGSSAVCDVNCLHALSKRIHYGKFVAEAKFQVDTEKYTKLILKKDAKGIMDQLVNKDIEKKVLDRVALKAATYGQEPGESSPIFKIRPDFMQKIYREYIIPLTCEVEVEYLLARLSK